MQVTRTLPNTLPPTSLALAPTYVYIRNMPRETAMHVARIRQGLTLLQVADRCAALGEPVSEAQMSRIDRGHATPHPGLRAVLAKVLDLDAHDDFERVACLSANPSHPASPSSPATPVGPRTNRATRAAGTARSLSDGGAS